MHIASVIYKNKMICSKCRGKMVREEWFDLPKGFFEFFCLNCGERVWVRSEITEHPIYTN
ncbi:MAG: hypothetical protein ACLFQV_02020 [Vulcanimicrobiota bacterium]